MFSEHLTLAIGTKNLSQFPQYVIIQSKRTVKCQFCYVLSVFFTDAVFTYNIHVRTILPSPSLNSEKIYLQCACVMLARAHYTYYCTLQLKSHSKHVMLLLLFLFFSHQVSVLQNTFSTGINVVFLHLKVPLALDPSSSPPGSLDLPFNASPYLMQHTIPDSLLFTPPSSPPRCFHCDKKVPLLYAMTCSRSYNEG